MPRSLAHLCSYYCTLTITRLLLLDVLALSLRAMQLDRQVPTACLPPQIFVVRYSVGRRVGFFAVQEELEKKGRRPRNSLLGTKRYEEEAQQEQEDEVRGSYLRRGLRSVLVTNYG